MNRTLKLILNVALLAGIIIATYFLHLALTPEGYTGIFLMFSYDVHSPQNPAIILGVLIIAFVALNWSNFMRSKNKVRLTSLVLAGVLILAAVFFFLNYKRHNRLPWERPNVVMVVVDTLRSDHISAYGDSPASTPHIDSLAEDGWLFEQAFSHIPITMPSHSSLFTGRLPHEVWVLNNRDDFTYPENTLAEIYKNEGYKTGAAISLGVLKANFNLNRGFDSYDDRLPRNGQWFNRANVITDRGIAFIEKNVENEDDRFFLWLHYSDPHEPYDPPGTPDDTAIKLNGEELATGSLDSAARLDIDLTLQPGKNIIEIERLFDEGVNQYLLFCYFTGTVLDDGPFPENWAPKLENARRENRSTFRRELRLLQTTQFLTNFDGLSFCGLTFTEGSGWHAPSGNATRARRDITSRAVMHVENTTGEPMPLTFHLKGGLNKPLRMVKQQYAGEVEFTDQEIGRFLDHLKERGLYDNTIIVFLSDHGEELNEHGLVGHIHNLYTQSLQVPLIIRDPKSNHRPRRVPEISSLRDIAPTVLDMSGITIPEYMTGRTLMEHILRNRSAPRQHYGQTFMPEAQDNKLSIQDHEQIGLYLPEAGRLRQLEVYDLINDPMQWLNEALSGGSSVNAFREEAEAYHASIDIRTDSAPVESEREEMLRDLGYVTGNRAPAMLDNLGTPSQRVLTNVRNAMSLYEGQGVANVAVAAQKLGGGEEGHEYIGLVIDVTDDSPDNIVIPLQHHVKITVSQQTRQFPLRLTVQRSTKVLLDRVFPGDTRQILDLYTSRLLRLIMQQPFGVSIGPAYEQVFPTLSKRLEAYVGLGGGE